MCNLLKLEEARCSCRGYGLKYFDSFQNTHLGQIGKPRAEPRRPPSLRSA